MQLKTLPYFKLSVAGCQASTAVMPDLGLLASRWIVSFKKGLSGLVGSKEDKTFRGRHGCYGRMSLTDVQPTVVGRAEPHNLCLVSFLPAGKNHPV